MRTAVAAAVLAAGCSAAVPVSEAQVSLDGRRLELLLDACNADTQMRVDEAADQVARCRPAEPTSSLSRADHRRGGSG